MRGMVINMEEAKLQTLEQIKGDIRSRIPCFQRGVQPVYRAGDQAIWLRSARTSIQGCIASLHLVVLDELTYLQDMVDTVSEMQDVKHAFRAGARAQPGIDL